MLQETEVIEQFQLVTVGAVPIKRRGRPWGRLSEATGARIPPEISEGDEVLYSKYGGSEITVDGEDLLVLRESDVLARVIG